MDINLEINIINKFLKNKFEFINIQEHTYFYNFEISYLEQNLLYVKVENKNKQKWNEDIKLIVYTLDEKEFEELSLGSCESGMKEIEFYTEIDLFEKEETLFSNIQKKIFINKSIINLNKKEYYELKYFFYKNNNYTFNNDFNEVNQYFQENYNHINELLEYVINENIKNVIKILIYLNKHGGIFMNQNLKNMNIDELNKNINCCYINNDILTIIFSKINFLNQESLIDDLKNKKKLKFEKYLNDFEIIYDQEIINDVNLKLDDDYYNNIIQFENYNIYILSKNNHQYNIEKLPNNYYCLNNENNIEDDLDVEIYDKSNNTKFKLDDKYIKNKFDNNIIFKL